LCAKEKQKQIFHFGEKRKLSENEQNFAEIREISFRENVRFYHQKIVKNLYQNYFFVKNDSFCESFLENIRLRESFHKNFRFRENFRIYFRLRENFRIDFRENLRYFRNFS
jgi:hypothetical protein